MRVCNNLRHWKWGLWCHLLQRLPKPHLFHIDTDAIGFPAVNYLQPDNSVGVDVQERIRAVLGAVSRRVISPIPCQYYGGFQVLAQLLLHVVPVLIYRRDHIFFLNPAKQIFIQCQMLTVVNALDIRSIIFAWLYAHNYDMRWNSLVLVSAVYVFLLITRWLYLWKGLINFIYYTVWIKRFFTWSFQGRHTKAEKHSMYNTCRSSPPKQTSSSWKKTLGQS